MKHRKKGRKIYTYHAKNRRIFSSYHPVRSAVTTILTLVVIAVLGFVGYNIVGPVITRLEQEEVSPTTAPPPAVTEIQPAETGEAVAEVPVTTAAEAVTTAPVTAAVTTTVARHTDFGADMTVAHIVPADALQSIDAMEDAAKTYAEEGYTSLILPLKLDSGMLQYASAVDKAVECGASNESMLTLREITNAANRSQMQCTALFSTLLDQTYSNYFMEGTYVFQDGATRWFDNKPEEGGKPWLNPFDPAASAYLSALAAEIGKSGFTDMICTNTVCPSFFQSDADLLGGHIMDAGQRKTALLSVANSIADAAPNAGLFVPLEDIIHGTAEVYDVQQLKMSTVYIRLDPDAFTEAFSVGEQRYDPTALQFWERIQLLAEAAQSAAGGKTVIPCLSGEALNDTQIRTAIQALQQIGCKTVYIL